MTHNKPAPTHNRKSISGTLLKGLDAMTVLASRAEGMLLPEIVEALNEPRSNVLRLLESLVLYGFVAKDGRIWRTTEAFQSWAVKDRHGVLKDRYQPVLRDLSREVGELVLLGLHEGNGVVHLSFIETDRAVHVAPAPFTRHNLRINALGKLALSRRPDLWEDLESPLLAELEQIRLTGIAWNREQSVQGMIAMAHAGFTNLPTDGMIAVAWPTHRFTEEKGQAAVAAIRRVLASHRPAQTAVASRRRGD